MKFECCFRKDLKRERGHSEIIDAVTPEHAAELYADYAYVERDAWEWGEEWDTDIHAVAVRILGASAWEFFAIEVARIPSFFATPLDK